MTTKQDEQYWQGRDFIHDLVDQIPAAIFWKDTTSTFLGCNKYFADFAALASPRDINGKTDYDLPWGKFQADLYIQDDKQIVLSRQPKLGIEEPQTLANGEELVLLTNKIPLFSKSGDVIGILGIYHDITARKNMELSLQMAKNKAEMASRAKTEFIANMSHDIRTPLSGVVGMSKLLEQNLTEPEYKQYARWINESGEQLLSLLNGILDILSTENISELDLNHEIFDLHQCIDEIIKLERPTTQLKGIELEVRLDESVPQYILSDHTKLHRILLNLVGNAIKFTQVGQVVIEVRLISLTETHAHLKFMVRDTGIGISQEMQHKVFDRFFRANPSYKGSYSGHGVGLHIAKSYVERLGSKLELKSEVGVGTTFSFDLQVQIDHSQQKFEQEIMAHYEQHGPALPTTLSHVPPHVLIVEDNAIALRMAEIISTQAGCCFTSVQDGESALELIKNNKYDLILTDIGLPGISGQQLTSGIRQWEQKFLRLPVPIVGLTAHTHAKAKEDCYQVGMNDVFCKPIDLRTMGDIIRQFVEPYMNSSIIREGQPMGLLGHDLPSFELQLFFLEQFPLLNFSAAAQRLGSDDLLREMLQLLLEQEIPADEQALDEAYTTQDWETIEKIAHKMKGGAIYCGTIRLQYACQYLERYRKAGHTVLLDKLYQQLIYVITETKQAILQQSNLLT